MEHESEHESNMKALLESPQPQAAAAMAGASASGFSFLEFWKALLQYGPALLAIFANIKPYLDWAKEVLDAIRNGKPLPPLPTV